ncbi:MAG: alpha/beta hydrolase [Pirellulales bacterium]|nr:alpha/beta hydrolase [Pirellulales bacterium]
MKKLTIALFWAVLLALAPVARVYAEPAVAEKPASKKAETAKSETPPYTQHMNVVFADTDDGVGLIMDIFTPTGKANGLAIIDIISGGWSAARGRLDDHKKAQIYDIACGRGYTVFAIRPGSSSKYCAMEMVDNLKLGIRWVKEHASEYKIDPDRMALTGASAGGHLTCLSVVLAEDGDPGAKDPLKRHSTRVKAAVAFFPPTDFLNWGNMQLNKSPGKSPVALMLGGLLFEGGIKKQTPEEIEAQMGKISPARLVTGKEPPMLLIHGDADLLVPLQQSQVMLEALKKAGVPCELIVKKGGGHPWATINEEVAIATDWMDRQLRAQETAGK